MVAELTPDQLRAAAVDELVHRTVSKMADMLRAECDRLIAPPPPPIDWDNPLPSKPSRIVVDGKKVLAFQHGDDLWWLTEVGRAHPDMPEEIRAQDRINRDMRDLLGILHGGTKRGDDDG